MDNHLKVQQALVGRSVLMIRLISFSQNCESAPLAS